MSEHTTGKGPSIFELSSNHEAERLSKELFFHFVDPRTYAATVAQDVLAGSALIGIAGRATVRSGFPDTYGPNLVFRVPEVNQPKLLTSTLDPVTEDPVTDQGLTSGNDSIFALLQRYKQPISQRQEAAISGGYSHLIAQKQWKIFQGCQLKKF